MARRRLVAGLLVAVVLAGATPLAQNLNTQIQIAIAQLTTGVTPFTNEGVAANGYISFNVYRGATGYGLRESGGALQIKSSLTDTWNTFPAGGAAPAVAKYILQQANATLPNAQALSALGSALLVNTTTTGVLTAYAGSTCTNQFVRALSALGVATCNSVSLTADVTGTLPATNGGTGVATVTTGDLLYGSAANVWSKLADIATGNVLLAGGVGTAPTWGKVTSAHLNITPTTCTNQFLTAISATGTGTCTTATLASAQFVNQGTAVTVLHGNAAGNPSFGAVSLTADVTGTLGADNGGTGLSTFAVGDLIYASATTPTLSRLADVATGSVLVSGGIGVAPAWSATPTLTSLTLGTSGILSGGTNTVEQVNGGNAQTFNLYNTFTDGSHFEVLRLRWSSNIASIITDQTGGSFRELDLGRGNAQLQLQSGTIQIVTGNTLQWSSDNTSDIGQSAANRPRTIYAATSVVAPAYTVGATAGASCTIVGATAHLTVVNGIVTLCN